MYRHVHQRGKDRLGEVIAAQVRVTKQSANWNWRSMFSERRDNLARVTIGTLSDGSAQANRISWSRRRGMMESLRTQSNQTATANSGTITDATVPICSSLFLDLFAQSCVEMAGLNPNTQCQVIP